MSKPLTQVDLNKAQCHSCMVGTADAMPHSHEKTERLWLHGRCHPNRGTRVSYTDGVISITCRECRKLIAEVAVAP